LVLLALAILSFRQVLTWRSTETLFTRILQINPRSNLALTKLSHEKLEAGDLRAANEFAQRALAVHPDVSLDWINVGKAMEDLHHPDLARKCYLHVLQTDSSRDSAGAYSNLAAMRADAGDYAGAIKLYQQALAHDPDLPAARIGLASARRQLAKTQ
jgi:tetratricopeptide (TPR) repeat protein